MRSPSGSPLALVGTPEILSYIRSCRSVAPASENRELTHGACEPPELRASVGLRGQVTPIGARLSTPGLPSPTPYHPWRRNSGRVSGVSRRRDPCSPCTTSGLPKAIALKADPPIPRAMSAAAYHGRGSEREPTTSTTVRPAAWLAAAAAAVTSFRAGPSPTTTSRSRVSLLVVAPSRSPREVPPSSSSDANRPITTTNSSSVEPNSVRMSGYVSPGSSNSRSTGGSSRTTWSRLRASSSRMLAVPTTRGCDGR